MAGVDLLDGVTLTRDAVSSIEFDNISQSYNHLWILGTWANSSHFHWGSSMAVDFEIFASDSASTGWGTSGSWSMCTAGSVVIGSSRILNMHNSYLYRGQLILNIFSQYQGIFAQPQKTDKI